jgi:hypothetical protein
MAVRGLSNKREFMPTLPFLAIIGNQRIKIARDNGFSHIDAFIVATGKESLILKKSYDASSSTD